MHSFPSAVLYINQCQVPRITQGTNPSNVVLLLVENRLKRRPFLGLEHVIEGSVGHRDRFVQALHLRHVFCLARIVLLAVGLTYLGVGLHDDPRLGSIDPCLPRALCARDLAVFVLLCVLPEVPYGAFLVLGEPVVGLFDELAFFPSPVIYHDTLYSHYHLGGVGDSHLVALSFPLVDEGGARLQREVLVVDFCGELGGIYMWSVSLVLLRGSLLLRGTFVLLRGGGVGAPRHEYQHRGYDCTP